MGLFLNLLVLLTTFSNLGCLSLVFVSLLFNLNHFWNFGFLNDFLANSLQRNSLLECKVFNLRFLYADEKDF